MWVTCKRRYDIIVARLWTLRVSPRRNHKFHVEHLFTREETYGKTFVASGRSANLTGGVYHREFFFTGEETFVTP